MKEKIIIVGGFSEIIELAEACNKEIVGIIDISNQNEFCGIPVLGCDKDAPTLFNQNPEIKLVLTPDKPEVRQKLFTYYSKIGFEFTSLVSPSSIISKSSKIGKGVVIQSNVNVSSNSLIGDFVKLNTMCNVMHDCTIGNFSTIAPNAVVLGRVAIGEKCYIGSNSTILPNLTILDNSTVGAGSVVTKNVGSNTVVKGNPAK